METRPLRTAPARARLESIDVLRGAVMVLMALDHARDYFFHAGWIVEHAEDPETALFLTRWVTHFCAPVFVLLAGTSARLWRARGRSAWRTSRYLATRGLWLVVLEFTLVHWCWHGFWPGFVILQVIAAIGAAMLALALLVHLPPWLVLALGLAICGGHNLLDAHACADWRDCPWWRVLFHQEGGFVLPAALQHFGQGFLYVKYPLLPWIGVIAVGYGIGGWFELPAGARRALLVGTGLVAGAAFVLLRLSNTYGDPVPFSEQAHGGAAWMRFLNCEKYPPSLLFLLMTLGPALLFLGLVDGVATADARPGQRLSGWLSTFGKVPLFFYLAHVLVLRLASEAWYGRDGDPVPKLLLENFDQVAGYPLPLPWTYVAWAGTVVLLYWPCRWYAGLKQRSRNPLLTYL